MLTIIFKILKVNNYLELGQEKYKSSSSLYFFLGFALVGVSCCMICISELIEWEIPLEGGGKLKFKMLSLKRGEKTKSY